MTCVIVVPVFKTLLNKYEEISLLQCKKIFGKYSIRIFAPKGLKIDNYYSLFEGVADLGHFYFPTKYFKSPQTYNRFMKSTKIYNALQDFDYFLMYHTDAFVFRDDLAYWMQKGYDKTIEPEKYLGVGNSGFSLHKISSALKVLKSFKKVYSFSDFLRWYSNYNWKGRVKHFPYFLRMLVGLGGWSHHLLNYSKLNEDIFWGIQVPDKFPEFKVAPFEEAYQFSMEYNCKKLLKLNNGNLPFGCHQWYKGEFLDFWKDDIGRQGYHLYEDL